jgi:hypothetical protein
MEITWLDGLNERGEKKKKKKIIKMHQCEEI